MHVVAFYVIALWLPGVVLGRLAGLRGWTLAATAPLLTYAVAGLAGPAFAALSRTGWSPASALALVAGLAIALAGVGAAVRRARPNPPVTWVRSVAEWTRRVNLGVAVAVAALAAFGAAVIGAGIGRLSAVPQDWDAAFHANGIRWIAETGDSSLVAMGNLNWFENGVQIFYPNAYHLVAAVVLGVTGADVPTVLNAHTLLLPGMAAVVVVALVHRFRGRAVHAVAAAACTVSITAFYDMLWRGPLLPYATGVALLPLVVVLLVELLDAPHGRSRVAAGLLFAVCLVGLICLNPAMLFSAALFALPALVQRWVSWPRLLGRELLVILGAGVVTALLAIPQLWASLGSASGDPFDWPAVLTPPQAVVELVTLSHGGMPAQVFLVVAGAVGLVRYPALRQLRWTVVVAVLFGTMFVLAASSDEYWVNALTRPWWNDRWRLIGLFVVPFAVLAGHGLAELQRGAALVATAAVRRSDPVRGQERARRAAPVAAAGLLIALSIGFSDGLYAARNVGQMTRSAPDGPVVSSLEVDAMRELTRVVPPGQRVLNDRYDGSVWMYAIGGVLPVAGHYDARQIGPDASLLGNWFFQYPDNPDIRAAVERLGVSYVMVARGFVRAEDVRAPGLVGLEKAGWLDVVYENPDAVIYRIRSDVPDLG